MAAAKGAEDALSGNRSLRRPLSAAGLVVAGGLTIFLAVAIAGFMVPNLLTAGAFAVWAATLVLLLLMTTAVLPLPAAYLFQRYAPGLPRVLAWTASLLSGSLLLSGLLRLISPPLSGMEGSALALSEVTAAHMERQPMYYLLLVPAMIGSLAVFYYVTDRES